MVLVWTATCREMHDGRLRGIVFTNEHGQKRNVTIENMEDFFKTHYVSNLVFESGRLRGIGITLNQLDTYNLTKSGQYRITQGIGETNIYGLAAPYINNQRIKMREDKANGRLKTEEQDSSGSNDGELTGAQKLAVATAVAGATVVGVNKLAKVVSNQINSKKYAEIKQEAFDKLTKYQGMIEEIIRVKNETNKQVQNNPSIVKYSSNFESRNALTPVTQRNIQQYGIVGCITNIQTLMNQCSQSIQAYNLMDSQLDDIGVTGTLRVQFNLVESRLNNLKQLHLRTKQLVENNIQMNNNARQQEMYRIQQDREQQEIVRLIENELNSLEASIASLQAIHEPADALSAVRNISTQSLKDRISTLLDEDKRNEYYDYIYSLESQISEKEVYYANEQRLQVESSKQEGNRQITFLITTIEDLKRGRYSGDEAHQKLETVKVTMNTLESKIPLMDDSIRSSIERSFNNIKKSWQSDEYKVTQSIDKANQLADDKIQLDSYIDTITPIIERIKAATTQDTLNEETKTYRELSQANYALISRLKRTADIDTKNRIDSLDRQLAEAKNTANSNIQAKLSELKSIFDRVTQELEAEAQRIKNIIVDDSIEQSDIDSLTVDTSCASKISTATGYSYSQVNKLDSLVSRVNKEYERKKDAMQTKLKKKQTEYEALQAKKTKINSDINSELAKIDFDIDICTVGRIGPKSPDSIMRKLTTVLDKYDIALIDNIDDIKSRIQQLITKLDNKVATEQHS